MASTIIAKYPESKMEVRGLFLTRYVAWGIKEPHNWGISSGKNDLKCFY
jgi:hypothetical protein